MDGKWIRGLACGVMALSGGVALAADAVVQDFDGWKIMIQPGDFPAAKRSRDDVPPSPKVMSSNGQTNSKAPVRLISLQEEDVVVPPRPAAKAAKDEDDGLPLIVPGVCYDKETVVAVEPPAGRVDPRYLSQMYTEVYKSIPFIRAEYDANPSYIHDSTMEILFGQMRPTVIQRGTTTVNHNYPDFGYGYGYGFNGYAYPPLQLVIPGVGLRIHRSQ